MAVSRRFRLAFILVLVGGAFLGALAIGRAWSLNRSQEATLNASKTQAILDRSLEGATGLRVWGAGMRTGDDTFCSCVIVPNPPRVFYESKDPQEVRELIAKIHPRPYTSLSLAAVCGSVTFDFLRGDRRIFTMNIHGVNLSSTGGFIPITSESSSEIEEWLRQRSIREHISAALNQSPRK